MFTIPTQIFLLHPQEGPCKESGHGASRYNIIYLVSPCYLGYTGVLHLVDSTYKCITLDNSGT